MSTEPWLADIRVSYDTVAGSYADQVRGFLDEAPYVRAVLALFVELVQASGGGLVADVGCGPGQITEHLHRLGAEVFGLDLSPGMIEVAQRDHPGLRFEVGSMTDLRLADASLAGLVAWYSLIHIPDNEIGVVFAQFRRVLRPDGLLLVGFHIGDTPLLKTQGYGGHPMKVYVHRRRLAHVEAWLEEHGFAVEAQVTLSSRDGAPAGILVARRQPAVPDI
ncbi:MAG TPA: class I SAM-dependent methyltransferase [Kineosporiaceae bacterium]|nr:class I SAM-dependent methyltransferase [Kineosporiaceae bacterium]